MWNKENECTPSDLGIRTVLWNTVNYSGLFGLFVFTLPHPLVPLSVFFSVSLCSLALGHIYHIRQVFSCMLFSDMAAVSYFEYLT